MWWACYNKLLNIIKEWNIGKVRYKKETKGKSKKEIYNALMTSNFA